MKKIAFIILSCIVGGACSDAPTVLKQPVSEEATNRTRQGDTVVAHTLEKDKESRDLGPTPPVEKSDEKTTWTRSGDPIDTSKFDQEIEAAERSLKADSNAADKKNALSDAYFKRGFALTQARQYASAIGDYRAALRYSESNEDAKQWIATISGIYQSMNREIPKPGEEPKPLEFKKETEKKKS